MRMFQDAILCKNAMEATITNAGRPLGGIQTQMHTEESTATGCIMAHYKEKVWIKQRHSLFVVGAILKYAAPVVPDLIVQNTHLQVASVVQADIQK